ncbi:hypothetical protein COCVIDRAFT_43910, partial [Bipolaris victoriae FI3]
IRLIRLHPGGFNDCIRCTIYHASIPENPPQAEYIALSYVWGDPRKTEPIRLGADFYKSFQITTNLYTALRYLRDRDSERILWVDAICINQSDEEERFSQVRKMGFVYKMAAEVRIWLG